jgi:hypothetical protein
MRRRPSGVADDQLRRGGGKNGAAAAVHAHVSRRALEEIYFPPFRRALLDAGAGSVMGSYNQVNGCYACQSLERSVRMAVHPGRYEVLIGASSADLRLSAFVEITDQGVAVT